MVSIWVKENAEHYSIETLETGPYDVTEWADILAAVCTPADLKESGIYHQNMDAVDYANYNMELYI